MNGPEVHNGQGNKLDTERKRLYCLTYMWHLEKPSRKQVGGCQGQRMREGQRKGRVEGEKLFFSNEGRK